MDDARSLKPWVEQAEKVMVTAWVADLEAQAKSLSDVLPPMKMIRDPKMLTSVSCQQSLFANPRRGDMVPTVCVVTKKLNVLAAVQKEWAMSQELKQAHAALTVVKNDAKMCLALDHCLHKVLRNKATTPEAMLKQAEECLHTVKTMGATLPEYMDKLFQTMKSQTASKK